ncbi:MAG: hypothetical protein ACFCUG_07420 [Thiotrichales bacterium]
MRRCPTALLLALAGLSACGGSDAPAPAASDAAEATATVPAVTDPSAPVARIVAAAAASERNSYPITLKMEKGTLASDAVIEVLTQSGERVAGTLALPADHPQVTRGDEVGVHLVLSQAATLTDALLSAHGAIASYADAETLLAPAEAPKTEAKPETGASIGGKPVQFACSLNGTALASAAYQGFSMGAGHAVAYLGQSSRDLLAYVAAGAQGEASYSNTPVEGARPAIDGLPPGALVTVVLALGSTFPDDASKALHLTMALKDVSLDALANLPLTVPVIPSTVALTATPTSPGAEVIAQFAHNMVYVATGGEVVIEAVDPAHRSIRGTLRADLKVTEVGGDGEKLFGATVAITDGRFDIPPTPVKKDTGAKKSASAAH